jgi:hypothetical protein
MYDIAEDHLERLRVAVLKKHSAATIAKWITENTSYAGQPYSYADHEYQERILSDTSQDIAVRKCSQVGLSECSARMALSLVNVISPYTVAYTLPTAHFAGTFAKTRIDPVIEGSKKMSEAIHKTADNNEVKRFGDSFLFIRGAASSNAPISIPCDHLIHDEVDFSDQEVLGQYTSRLTHSKWKRVTKLSTPTLPGFGVDKAFQDSRRHWNHVRCNHCGHWFVPDYYKHVKVPGFLGDLREINKQTLTRIKWEEAALLCPSCGKQPSLQPQYREWVCENPTENHACAGYQVTPFDAPNIITPSYLVKASTSYDRVQDFQNFSLGIPAEDKEATLTREDFVNLFVHEYPGTSCAYVMGVDVGNVYHFAIGAIDAWGDLFVVHTEQVPMGKAKTRYFELRDKFRVVCTVIDSGPHAETVMSIQEKDVNCYASVYMRSKSILTHNVVDKDDKPDEGQSFVRQVNVNRSRAFDAYMNFIRENHLKIRASDEDETIIQHHTDMKRVKVYDNDSGEMQYSWQKSSGTDHYHHCFLYMWVAGKIKGVGRPTILLPTSTIFTFKNNPQQ